MKRFLTTGFFGAFLGIVIGGAPADASLISRGFLDEVLTSYATTTALDLKANKADLTDLSDKIGSLPEGITVQGMYEGWTDSRGNSFPGLYGISKSETLLLNAYNSESAFLLLQGAKATTIDGVDYTGPIYPLWKLSEGIDKIGTLPSGAFLGFPHFKQMFDIINFEYPQNLSQLIYGLFGNTETNTHGAFSYLMNDIIGNLPFGGKNISEIIGEPIQNGRYSIPIYELIYWGTNNSTYLLPNMNGTFSDAPLLGLYELSNRIDKIGTVPEGKNLAGMISETDAKIGTLPTEYATVGAALTAMDAKIDARELPSSSADGQYVLSAKKVGDTITYTWVKMDLTSEEQAQ